MKQMKCERGSTLVELLAALSLLSIILIFGVQIYISIQKQADIQTNEVQVQTNERLVMNILLKEIRKAESVEVSNANVLILNNQDMYWLDDITLKKNDVVLASNIAEFTVIKNGDELRLKIGRLPETILYIRG